jgi:rod shape-determining protein MreD
MMFIAYIGMIFFQWIFSYQSLSLNLSPDIIFIFVFWANYYKNPVPALIFSFFSGLYADFYYTTAFGSYTLSFVLFAFIVNKIKSNIEVESFIPRLVNFVISNYSIIVFVIIINLIVSGRSTVNYVLFFQPFLNIIFFEIFRYILNRFFNRRREYVRL